MVSRKYLSDHVKSIGAHNSGHELLVDQLFDIIKKQKEVNKILKEEGLSVWGNSEQTFKVRNQHLKTYMELHKAILDYCKALGITYQKLEQVSNDNKNDGFEDHQND